MLRRGLQNLTKMHNSAISAKLGVSQVYSGRQFSQKEGKNANDKENEEKNENENFEEEDYEEIEEEEERRTFSPFRIIWYFFCGTFSYNYYLNLSQEIPEQKLGNLRSN